MFFHLGALSGALVRPPVLEIPRATWVNIFFDSDRQSIGGRSRLSNLQDLRRAALPTGDIEIRLWTGFGLSYLEGLRLRKAGGVWTAWWLLPAMPTHPEYAKAHYVRSLDPPKSGWAKLWHGLNDREFFALPDYHTLKGWHGVLDGYSYVVEISKNNRYRTYCYENPAYPERPEAEKIIRIHEYLLDQFPGWKTPYRELIREGQRSK